MSESKNSNDYPQKNIDAAKMIGNEDELYNLEITYKQYKKLIKSQKRDKPEKDDLIFTGDRANPGHPFMVRLYIDYHLIFNYIDTVLFDYIVSDPDKKYYLLMLEEEKQKDKLTELLKSRYILNLFVSNFKDTPISLPLYVEKKNGNNLEKIGYNLIITGYKNNPTNKMSRRQLGLIAVKKDDDESIDVFKKFKTVKFYDSSNNDETKQLISQGVDVVGGIQYNINSYLNQDESYPPNKNYIKYKKTKKPRKEYKLPKTVFFNTSLEEKYENDINNNPIKPSAKKVVKPQKLKTPKPTKTNISNYITKELDNHKEEETTSKSKKKKK